MFKVRAYKDVVEMEAGLNELREQFKFGKVTVIDVLWAPDFNKLVVTMFVTERGETGEGQFRG
jgi:predicted YcjX-like family ATPase